MSADERHDAAADAAADLWRCGLLSLALLPETPGTTLTLARLLLLPPQELLADPERCDRIIESAFNEAAARRGEPPSDEHKGVYTGMKARAAAINDRVTEAQKVVSFAFDGLFEPRDWPPPGESTG